MCYSSLKKTEEKLSNDDTITLILCGNRILASKEKLACKSRYFECLFSDKFCDFTRKEIDINYDIQLETLQDFIDWTNSDVTIQFNDGHIIKTSLSKYVNGSYLPLLTLLEIGCTFIVDSLIGDVMDVLVHHWFEPEIVIDVWLMAQEISYTKLKDVAFAVCLDRFMELPTDALLKLSTEKFTQLIKNVNIRSSDSHLHSVTKKWIKKNNDGENLLNEISNRTEYLKRRKVIEGYSRNIREHNENVSKFNLYENNEYDENSSSGEDEFYVGRRRCVINTPRWAHSTYVLDMPPDQIELDILSCHITFEDSKNKVTKYVCSTDKSSSSTVTIELNNVTVPFGKMKGMEIIGRGFSIYFVGGVYDSNGSDSNSSDLGKFNMDIWRYCTLSEKFFYVARLPRPRKDMFAFFMVNKLMLVGGLDENRTILTSVDVLNIHTGEWIQAADIPNALLFKDDPCYRCDHVCEYYQSNNKWLTEVSTSLGIKTKDCFYDVNDYEWPSGLHLALSRKFIANDEDNTVQPTASVPFWYEVYYLNSDKRATRNIPINDEGIPEKCITEEFEKMYQKYPTELITILNPASLYRQFG
ncbi:uncharacterized protein LOC105694307 isoform X2 [Orussus abietinus]|uniref:uncharacterized protein LOC105694307 isoform X2 n=1 Tax=Orussus abietinus TaxID=222816 RepID=UPI000626C972|nr:uncharacterized protein LOC105694307 isoform X2 [Orussus abietinus]